MRKRAGIYIHIPFCKRRCFYCHFVTLPQDEQSIERYTGALLKEIRLKSAPGINIDSVYLGGGSPSLIGERFIFSIMEVLHTCFNIDPGSEISIECNPEDLSVEKLQAIKTAGFNRLSIGVQSFQSKDLQYLKRTHTVRQSLDSISNALITGIDNINLDFLIGLPTQTIKSLSGNFDYLMKFNIPHVSCYLLEQVPGKKVSESMEQKLFKYSRNRLTGSRYIHYEVSNFCKNAKECRHNLKYWKNRDYLGIGLSASGYENGVDSKNVNSLDLYIRKLNQHKLPIGRIKKIDPIAREIVVGLRLLEGIPSSTLTHRRAELNMLLDNRFLINRGRKIAVHPEKILLLNEILSYLID